MSCKDYYEGLGQWLWLSWQSGRFRYQRSAVRIQTPANFYRTCIIYCQLYCIEKKKIKEKEAGNGPFKKDYYEGCGGGRVVRVLAFYSNESNLKTVKVYNLYCGKIA